MDEEEYTKKVKRGKRFNYICFAVVIFIIFAALIASFAYTHRPLSPSLTVESAESALKSDYILVKAGDTYYELDGSGDFASLFRLNEWTLCDPFSEDNVLVTFHFGELYELYLYSDGRASFFDGYTDTKTKSTAYYEIPSDIAENIFAYIAENGTDRTLGDGTIGLNTFLN